MVLKVKDLPNEEYWLSGNPSCHGCPAAVGLRMALKALGPRTIMVVPAGCATIIQGSFPKTSARVPLLNIAFAAASSSASGVVAALEQKGVTDMNVMVWAGDGATSDIGMASLSGAAERNENMIYVCYDNEAYMNTGIQRSSSTPVGAWTTTTVTGKVEGKKDVPSIVLMHRVPYVATASVAFPLDFVEKVQKAAKLRGFKYIHLHAPCPPGWKFSSEKTIEVGRLAVQTGSWILYEVENGVYKLSTPSLPFVNKERRKPIDLYLKSQGRFSKMTEEGKAKFVEAIDENWSSVAERMKAGRLFSLR
ncbi:MAG TPA: 3-methyl-2-oxobutanoate dehydrogenase subunit beta [Conexivisphaerales archaeon]|nr:3-methyl-2-oxobutanoate dehydrogenase subunit beta [Conexivisphaerales archaeon]